MRKAALQNPRACVQVPFRQRWDRLAHIFHRSWSNRAIDARTFVPKETAVPSSSWLSKYESQMHMPSCFEQHSIGPMDCSV